jgi:hypothetical protein
MTFTVTREQLYDLVWSEPMHRLAKRIGISAGPIAKHCRKLGVPIPDRSYWNKLTAGKSVTRVTLPERDLATVNRVSMSGTLSPELRARLKGEPGVSGDQNESIEVLAERLRQRLGTVTVPRNFSPVHPAIATLLKKDEKLRQEFALHQYSWHQPHFDSPFERRRLLFLNGLFLGFAKVGGNGWTRGADARELAIYMGDVSVSFKLDRPGEGRNGRRASSLAPECPQTLCLHILHQRTLPNMVMRWQDDEGCPLEKQLTGIVVGMAVVREHLHRQWQEEQAAWERERREEAELEAQGRELEAERRESERVVAIEKAKIDGLLRDADAWRNAANIRAYIEAARQAIGDQAGAHELEAWSRWALAQADTLDPLVSGAAGRISPDTMR